MQVIFLCHSLTSSTTKQSKLILLCQSLTSTSPYNNIFSIKLISFTTLFPYNVLLSLFNFLFFPTNVFLLVINCWPLHVSDFNYGLLRNGLAQASIGGFTLLGFFSFEFRSTLWCLRARCEVLEDSPSILKSQLNHIRLWSTCGWE